MIRSPILRPEASGVYRTPAEAAALRHCVLEGGGLWIEADLGPVGTKRALLDTFARAASFPPGFGYNWDALADSLQDLPSASPAYVLRLRRVSAAQAALGAEWMTFLEILEGAAMYWKQRRKPFVAFIDHAAELPEWS